MSDQRAPFLATDNPNSQHQTWSRWEFGVQASPHKLPRKGDVIDNARRYFASGFKSEAGRLTVELLRTPLDIKALRRATYYHITVLIEGPPASDPGYRRAVQDDFTERFMRPGFGPSARLVKFACEVVAGEQEDGSPPSQLLVMPSIRLSDLLFSSP